MKPTSYFNFILISIMSTLQLLDLPMDILFHIFFHVPLKDKLHTLLKMSEFRPFLEHRVCYLTSSAPFSLEYITLLRSVRPGWYVCHENWFHRFYLQIEETTLHVTKCHFLLGDIQHLHRPNSHVSFYRAPIDKAKSDFALALSYFEPYEDKENLLTYHIKGYGFIIVYYTPRSAWQEIHLSKMRKYMMRINEPILLTRFVGPIHMCHFEVRFTEEKKLIVQCFEPNSCQCDDKVQKLDPITFDVTKDYKYLIWKGGNRIPVFVCADYRLEDDHHVEGFRIYHYKHVSKPFNNMRQFEEGDEHDKHLKKFVWPKSTVSKFKNCTE